MMMSKEDARDLISGDLDGWELVEEIYIGKRRWETDYRAIVLNEETGKHYSVKYSVGNTEDQDTRAFEYSEPNFIEIEPIEVVKTEWRAK